ncbi:hypothetical protein BGW38_008700 [Lunasporangiospora selenospora]|uniref:Uncharacterized protein n=1 Tax=Lunasporangiospora selenospora TaxID=979761 RepID=A0A9P6FJ90_9FUNG|nr:hypothetical protein BGW38_008700 [Lunasporangiospora selenospora]
MSRGKRDGILKNEKGRVVVKVGAMHLKGAHNIEESLYPLLVEDPSAFLYQHPHTAAMAPDMRWSTQSQPQPTHAPYHESDSPKARHSDIHSNHHFTQGVHGDYYSQQQHHPVFRSHNGNSPHGSPHGSNGSVSGDEDPNLVSPFEYRVQSSMPTGLIGIPSGGAPIPDLRTGGHHASPGPYYGAAAAAHVQPKYQDSILHPNQHQLQLGGPLASDSPPSTSSPHGKMMESRLYSYAPYHKAF